MKTVKEEPNEKGAPSNTKFPLVHSTLQSCCDEMDGLMWHVPISHPSELRPQKPSPTQNHICHECGRTFTEAGSLKRHQLSHSDEKCYQCPFPLCGKSFYTQTRLREHQQVHERPFSCQECSRTFAYSRALKEHQLRHTGDRDFQCPFTPCMMKFYTRSSLMIHKRVHTGERFTCTETGCEKAFIQRRGLKRHLMTHKLPNSINAKQKKSCVAREDMGYSLSASTPNHAAHVCQECGRVFKKTSNLKEHQQIHTQVKPFQCPFIACKRKFYTERSLRMHKRIHTGERFTCSKTGCGKEFVHGSSLKRHMMKHAQESSV